MQEILKSTGYLDSPARHRTFSLHDDPVLREGETESIHKERVKSLSAAYANILDSIGENSKRQGKFFILLSALPYSLNNILCHNAATRIYDY